MIVCPVCEHAQAAGPDCDVCGRRLAGTPATGGATAALDGLEPTAFPFARADGAPLDDLDPTRQAPVDVREDLALDLEPTRVGPVDADAPAVDGLEPTEAAGLPGDGPTALSALVTCRYCRTPAAPDERSCGRCGMRLPAVEAPATRPAAEAERRCGCGALVRGARCPSCGARAAG